MPRGEQQRADGAVDALRRTLGVLGALRRDDRSERLGHTALGGDEVGVVVHPDAQRGDGIVVGEQWLHAGAQVCALGAVDLLDQRLAAREGPVERADSDAGLAGEGLRTRRPADGEGGAGHLQEAVPVAPGVRTQAWFTVGGGHESEVPPVVAARYGESSA
ncbi:hypothetical protein [Streptomyces phaeochromogenes]